MQFSTKNANSYQEDGMTTGTIKGKAGNCFLYGAGIILTLGVHGLLQERIMTRPYQSDTMQNEFDYYRGSVFLVLCNRLVAVLAALSWMLLKGDSLKSNAPFWRYFAVSLTNVCATTCQYEALHWVSFPVLMLGKSFKMLPVMLWMTFLVGKTYGVKDYLASTVVTLGVCTFITAGSVASPLNPDSSIYGVLLLAGFCAFDSFTSSAQEQLFKEHKTSTSNQMLYINLSSFLLALFCTLVSGELVETIKFALGHHRFAVDALCLSGSAVAAQFFIFADIKEFGALCLAATMNVRQVMSILMSYMYYGHPVTPVQITALITVFGSLFWTACNALNKNSLKKTDERSELLPTTLVEGSNKAR